MTGQDKLMRHWIKTLEHRREQFFFIFNNFSLEK